MEGHVTPRISKTLLSVGLGVVLVCSMLFLFASISSPATAAPAPPKDIWPAVFPQAIVPVTTTIQAAINAANPGDTVVFTGTYTEEVTINKSLTLQGGTPTSAIVYNGVFPFPSAPSIRITTDSVTITNMTLQAVGTLNFSAVQVQNAGNVQITGVAIQNYPTGIEVLRTIAGPSAITLTNNIIQGPGGGIENNGGIYFSGTGAGAGAIEATVQSNHIYNYNVPPLIKASGLAPSLISSNVLTPANSNADGTIYLNQSGVSLVQNNQLIAAANPVIGIRVTGSANPTVTQNVVDSQFIYGMQVDGTSAPTITNSALAGHNTYGIRILESATPLISSNTFSNNLISINVEGTARPQILTNTLTNGSGLGGAIQVSGAATPTIGFNQITNNPVGIIYNSSAPLSAFGNTICQNSAVGLSNGSGLTQTTTGNWWGQNPPLDTDATPPSDISGPVNTSPISMTLVPTSTLIPLNGTVNLTLTMRGGGYDVLDGTAIGFSATGGTFGPTNTTTLAGETTTVYSGTVLGTHTITATDSCGGVVTATVIIGEPVLTATKFADPLPGTQVRPGDSITYTVLVTNTGGFTATGVVFSDTVPTFTQLATASVNSGVIAVTDPVSATFDPIPPNNGVMSVTMRVTVTLPLTNGTLLTNMASISYDNGTSNVITTTNAVTHQVTSSPDITVTKSALPLSGSDVSPGDFITYTLTLTNQGDANATNVVISDTIPANTFLVTNSATSNVVVTPGDPLQADIAFLPAPAGTAQITFTVRVTSPLDNNTLITNTAQVTSAETSAVITYSNQVTHRVQSAAVLTIAKTAIPPAGSVITPADTITYLLTITNTGNANANNVLITDTLPPEVNFVSGSASAVNGFPPVFVAPTLQITAPVLTGTLLNGTQSSIQVTFAVTVTTPLTNNTLITNTGYVTFTGSPVVTPSNVVTHLVQSSPDLTITKSADPPSGTPVQPGDTITYTLAVTNSGNANATGLVISDTLPQFANFVNGSAGPGASAGLFGNVFSVTAPLLAGDGGVLTASLQVTVTTPLTNGLILTNTADVTATEVTSLTVSNPVTHVVVSSPNITITKTAVPTTGTEIAPGDLITYTITVSNNGNANATNVVVSDTIPANTTAVFSAATAGVSLSGPNPLLGNIALLPAPNGVEVITVSVRVDNPLTDSTIITNTAWVTATEVPTITNSELVTHIVRSSPVLTLVKFANPPSPGPVRPTDTVTYTIVVSNSGNANATGVTISDTIPANTSFVIGSDNIIYAGGAGGFVTTLPGSNIRFWDGSIPAPNGVVTATFRVTVTRPLTNGTIITNTAQVTSTEVATVTLSNDVTHTVVSSPEITISKTANPLPGSQVVPGQAITYSLTITNIGDENAQGVVVTDTVPPYTNYVTGSSGTGSVAESGGVVTWNVGPLAVDTPVNAQIVVTLTTPLTDALIISNTGYVTHTGSAVITASNTVTHEVESSPNVTYTKTAQPPAGSSLNLVLSPPTLITYTITVTNNGNANATGLRITDTVPANTSGVDLNWFPDFLAGNGGVVSNTFAVTVDVPLPDLTIIRNEYEASYNEVSGVFTSSSVLSPTNVVTHLIRSQPIISVTKSSVPTPTSVVTPGQVIDYSLIVTNSGSATATNFVLTDVVPLNTTFVPASESASAGATVVESGGIITLTTSALVTPNNVITMAFRATVTSPLANNTIISNVGDYSFDQSVGVSQTNVVTHLVQSSPILTITKDAVPLPGQQVSPDDLITYTLTISNSGDANATNVTISDTVRANTNFVSGTPVPVQNGSQLSWNVGTVPAPTGTTTITFTVRVTRPLASGTIITNTAQVTSTEVATVTFSNDVTHEVVSSPEITITKSADPLPGSQVVPGQTITYTLTITNIGGENAVGVVVTDTLSPYVNFFSATPDIGYGFINQSGNAITWTVNTTLTVDTPVSARIVATVRTPLTDALIISNTGYVTHTGSAVITASNTVTHEVESSPNVTYTKTAQPPAGSSINLVLSPPTLITYTITVTNNGNANATGLRITDTVPANTSGVDLNWFPDFLAGNGGVVSNTFAVTVDVPLPDLTIIRNEYEAGYNEISGVFTSSSVLSPTNVVTHLIRSQPIISVTKSSVPTPTSVVTPGQVIDYSLIVTNSGSATATNFVLTDVVPLNTTFVPASESASAGATVVESGGIITLTTSALVTPNNVITMAFRATVTSPLANNTIISNVGDYSFDQSVGVSQTNVVTHLVQSSPDITLTKTAVPPDGSPVTPGDFITYTITITNNGTADATGAVLTDAIPQYTQYAAGTASPAPSSTSPLVWNLGVISGGGGVATATFVVRVDSPLTNALIISNSAVLDIVETTGLSQTNVVTHLVQSSTDITVTKSAVPASGNLVSPGDTITYTLVAANTGTQLATGVLMTDTLPAEVNVVNVTGSKAPAPVVAGNQLTWNIGTLTTNEVITATIEVTVTTPLTSGIVITNQGQMLTAQTGLSTTNFVTHTVISTPTLTLSKSATPSGGSAVSPASTITYTLAVTNSGNGPATSFQITDTLPVSTSLAGSVNTTPGFSSLTSTNLITVNGTLGAGQSMTATFVVSVATNAADGTVLSNTGYVSYAESPVVSQTNTVTHVVQLTPAITLTKVAQPAGPTITPGDAITYTVTITNNGLLPATNLVITDFIPVNTNYVAGSFTSTMGTTSGPDPLRVDVASLGASSALSFTFQVTVTTPITNGAVISNAAQMTANFLSLTNSNEVTHTVVATPNLIVSKSAMPSAPDVLPGSLIAYTIWVTNTGNGNATNIIITDTLPISTELVLQPPFPLLIPSIGTVYSSTSLITATIPTLAGNGGLVQLMFVAAVTDTAPAGLVITNSAQISSDSATLTTTNVVTHIVNGAANITVVKSSVPVSGTLVAPGSAISYTVTLTNNTGGALSNVSILDVIDSNTSLVSATPVPPTPFAFGTFAQWASLAAGNSVSLLIEVDVTAPLTAGTIITNSAVGINGADIVVSNPVTHAIGSVTVAITKTDNVTIVQPGDTLTYTVTFSNSGNVPATGLVITDALPVGVNYVSGSASGGGLYNAISREITWTVGTLTDGLTLTRTFVVTMDNPLAAGISSLTNTVTVVDDSAGSDTATDVDLVNAAPILVLTKSPSGVTEPGQIITYTLTYTNSGNQDAANVTISETVPANTNFNAGVSSVGWGCADNAPAGSNCLFNVGAVSGGNGGGAVTFAVTVASPLSNGTVISNTGYLTDTSSITSSNTVTHVVQVLPTITMTKVADPAGGSTVNPADTITYTVWVTNSGLGDAPNMVITDVVPTYTNYVTNSVNSSQGSVSQSPNLLVVNAGTLTASTSMSFTFQVTVTTPLTNGTLISNQADLTADPLVSVTSNVVTHTVAATANLVVQKSSLPPSGAQVDPGDPIVYRVGVTNIGNANAANVRITDTLPISTQYALSLLTPNIGTESGPDPLVVDIPSLAGNGGWVTYTLVVTVDANAPAGLVISNVAQINSDNTGLTNTNTVTHEVRTTPVISNLTISKVANPPAGTAIPAGSALVYTVTVTNTGSTTLTNITLDDTLDANTNLVSATPIPFTPFVVNSTATWLTSLPVSSSVSLVLQVNVPPTVTTGTVITNTAEGLSGANLVATGPVTHVISGTVVVTPSLAITKTATPGSGGLVAPGEAITYTLSVVNNGTGPATGVVISDTLDANVTLVNSSTTTGTVSSLNPIQVSGFNLAVGEGVTVTLGVSVTGSISGTVINNRASVSSTEITTPTVSSLVTHTITNTVAVTPSMIIAKTAQPASGTPIAAGSSITYTVTITNNGTITLTGVSINDILDTNTTVVFSSTTPPATSVSGSNPVFATWASVPTGSTVSLVMRVDVTSPLSDGTVITNSAMGSSNETVGTVVATATHVISSTPALTPSLAITKTATPAGGFVAQGDAITYTITVQNNGTGPATGVVITDSLQLADVGYVTATLSSGSVSGPNPLVGNVGGLAVNETVTMTVVVTVTNNVSGTVINNVAQTSADTLAVQTSQTTTHTVSSTTIISPAFTLSKSAVPGHGSTVNPGDLITYTLMVTNTGGPATGFVLTDVLPSGTGYTGNSTTNLGGIVFDGLQTINIPAGAFPGSFTMIATLEVSVTANTTTTLSNQAQINSDQTAIQSSNTVTHLVQGTPVVTSNTIYLPIIFKNFEGSSVFLEWDAAEPVRDKVRDQDGNVSGSLTPDTFSDGVFRVGITIGSSGPKVVTDMRLVSTQGVTWDTSPGNTNPVLGVFNGGSPLNASNGSISGVLFNSGLVFVQLYVSDNTTLFDRFPANTYDYTLIINFSDGTSLSATTRIPGVAPPTPTPGGPTPTPTTPPVACAPTFIGDVTVGNNPRGVAVDTTRANRAYVANFSSNTLSVVDGTSVVQTISVSSPNGVAYDPTNDLIWVTNFSANQVTPINAATFAVLAPVNVGSGPWGVAYNASNNQVYVANSTGNSVTVIDATTRSLVTTLASGFNQPFHMAANPVTGRVYVTNFGNNTVAVINGGSVSSVGLGTSTQPYGVTVDETRNLVYVTTVNSNRIVTIGELAGIPDQILGWAEFYRGNDPARRVPMRAIDINPSIGPAADGGHLWTVTLAADGSEANQALLIGQGWPAYFDTPVPHNIGSSSGEGVAVDRSANRIYISNGATPGSVTILSDNATVCTPITPFSDNGFGFDVVTVE